MAHPRLVWSLQVVVVLVGGGVVVVLVCLCASMRLSAQPTHATPPPERALWINRAAPPAAGAGERGQTGFKEGGNVCLVTANSYVVFQVEKIPQNIFINRPILFFFI